MSPTNGSADPRKNALLAALPDAQLRQWLPYLKRVHLPLGEMPIEFSDAEGLLYFPTTAVCSLLYARSGSTTAEISVVGHDGLVGIHLLIGADSMPSGAVVQCAGEAVCISARTVREEYACGGAVMHVILQYMRALTTQMVQTAACNELHSLDQRLSRFLLLTVDRRDSEDLLISDELLAQMLGVSRIQAGRAARQLQDKGLIRHQAGLITVLDHSGLQRHGCPCYRTITSEYERLSSGDAMPVEGSAQAAQS